LSHVRIKLGCYRRFAVSHFAGALTAICSWPRRGFTRLHRAASTGNADKVDWILTHQPSRIDERDVFGLTPLQYASFWGATTVVHLLLMKGASLVPGRGWTPLTYAAAGGHEQTMRLLVKYNANVNQVQKLGHNFYAPIHIAVLRQKVGAVRVLLELGANPGLLASGDKTAMDLALMVGNQSIMEALTSSPWF